MTLSDTCSGVKHTIIISKSIGILKKAHTEEKVPQIIYSIDKIFVLTSTTDGKMYLCIHQCKDKREIEHMDITA